MLPPETRSMCKQAINKNLQKPRLSSKKCWSLRRVLLLMSLPMLLTACSTSSVKLVPVQPVPIPASLLQPCQPSALPSDPLTFGSSVEWNELLLTDIQNCNEQLAGISKIEASKQK